MQRLVHNALGQTLDPIQFRRPRAGYEDRKRQGRIAVTGVAIDVGCDKYMERATQSRNCSQKRVNSPNEIKRARQYFRKSRIDDVRFGGELKSDFPPLVRNYLG